MIGRVGPWLLTVALALAAVLALACGQAGGRSVPVGDRPAAQPTDRSDERSVTIQEGVMKFQLSSPSFVEGQAIPTRHTCDGPDVSPPLAWSTPPAATRCFALLCDDPDAPMGTWVHWVMFNIPAGATSLAENVAKTGELPDGSRQGVNSFRRVGYGGPCPPHGPAHRYYFKLFALSEPLDLPAGCTARDLERAMGGRVLASAQLMGRYGRRL